MAVHGDTNPSSVCFILYPALVKSVGKILSNLQRPLSRNVTSVRVEVG